MLSASQKNDDGSTRTWSEWMYGRPSPGTEEDKKWVSNHEVYMCLRTGVPVTPMMPTAMDKMRDCNGMGSDVGAKAGMGALYAVGEGAMYVASSVKAAGIAVVASPATPVVVGVAATGATAYTGYKIFRYFKPTQETREQRRQESAELERKTEQDKKSSEEARRDTEVAKEQTEKVKARRAFRECLDDNGDSCTLTPHGYPEECRPQARKLSVHKDGESEVVSMAKSFAMHSPWNKKKDKDKETESSKR